jgi:predicted amidohydrolase YtcJ
MSARTSVFLSALLLTLYSPFAGLAQKQVTVLRGATLIDVTNSTRVENSVVIMERGRFASVGKDGQVPVPSDAQVIDLKGKFLIPGFVDSHLHYRDWFGEILLANGITSLLDQANPTEWSLAMKEAQKKES